MINENIEDKFISEKTKNIRFIKIENYIDRFKKYLSVLIIIPTFIGGLWQFSSLISIDLEYVRFFSLTQLLSDGITLIIPLVLICVVLYVVYNMYSIAQSYAKSLVEKEFESKKSKFRLLLVFLITSICLTYFISIHYCYNFKNVKTDLYREVLFLFFIFTVPLVVINYHSSILFLKLKKVFRPIGILAFLIRFISIFLFVYILVDIIMALGSLSTPNNLLNLDNVHKSIKDKYELDEKNYSISYMNDTYIFVEVFLDGKKEREIKNKKVLILKRDELFYEN